MISHKSCFFYHSKFHFHHFSSKFSNIMSNQIIIKYDFHVFIIFFYAINIFDQIENFAIRYAIQQKIADQTIHFWQFLNNQLLSFLIYVTNNRTWIEVLIQNEFQKQWTNFYRIAVKAKSDRNRIDEIKLTIFRKWKKMQLNLNKKLFHYINNLRRLILRTIYFEFFVRINKTIADKMIHSIFKKNVFLNWTTNDLKKISEKKLFELSINQIFEKHKIFIVNNKIVISIIQNQILNEMITFASNLISSHTLNKHFISQNTVNTLFFFIFDIIFFYRFDSSSHFVKIDCYEKFHTIVDSIFFRWCDKKKWKRIVRNFYWFRIFWKRVD